MDQEVYVERLYNQGTVRLDPRHEKPTGSDAEWEFWGTDMSWEAYKAEHPDRASKAEHGHDDDAEWRGLGDEAPTGSKRRRYAQCPRDELLLHGIRVGDARRPG